MEELNPILSHKATSTTHVRSTALLSVLWRYRALIAGLLAIVLAVLGEALMRSGGSSSTTGETTANSGAELGSHLLQLAVLLVGLVAWVNDGLPRFMARRNRAIATATTDPIAFESADEPVSQFPTRPASSRVATGQPNAPSITTASLGSRLRAFGARYSEARSRLGWRGTVVGLLIVAGLAIWLLLLLRGDFTNSLAPWLWAIMLLALALTFVGAQPWPKGASLLAHDPHEPAQEPPVSRAEWIAVLLIVVAAALLRLWSLDSIPAGPYIDESGRALDARNINLGNPVNREQFVFFGTGWWGVPIFYFWLEAQSMKIFGDNLFGARMIHALAGIATVWYAYRIGRVVWSPRAGLLAMALLAVSDFAIQFSRTAGESTITLLTWTATFYYLYKALKTRRPLDFVLCGIAAGFTLYGYASGKLLPVFMVLIGVYILARWGLTGIKRYLPGLALIALAAALTFGPNALFITTQKPGALTERSNGVSILSPGNQQAAFTLYETNSVPIMLARQFGVSYAAFDVGHEKGPFYPTDQPVLPIPWAALWLLGTAYMVWRIGDARYAILALWLLGGLAGTALTNDTPTLQRLVGMVPTLALIPALFLDRIAGALSSVRWRVPLPMPRRASVMRWATNGALSLLVLGIALQTLTYYFGSYIAKANYLEFTLAGDYAGKLDPKSNVVYQLNTPTMFGDISPSLFLAKDAPMRDLANISDDLPVTNNAGKTVHYLIAPPDDPTGQILQLFYPQAARTTLQKNGMPFITAYKLTPADLDTQRHVLARYGPPAGPLSEQPEPRLGTLGPEDSTAQVVIPAGVAYPASAEWIGGLVAPVYGTYRLSVDAPGGAILEVDGRQVLTIGAGATQAAEVRVVLARGIHRVRLAGTLNSAQGRVELRWGADTGELAPVDRRFLWGGPLGGLVGEAYPGEAPINWFTDKDILQQTVLTTARRDGIFYFRDINMALGGGHVAWRGKILTPVAGDYLFDTVGPGLTTIWVDGEIVATRGNLGVQKPFPQTLNLTAGEHPFEVRYMPQQNGDFQLLWQPPGGQRVPMPPAAFVPPGGGVWLAEERPNVASPDPSLLHEISSLNVSMSASISPGGSGWREALGVGLLPDGRIVVGDTGNHRLLIYSTEGKQAAEWGPPVTEDNKQNGFNDLSDVAVAPDGVIAALDAENTNVRLFSSDGQPMGVLPLTASHIRGVAWGPDGKLYVANTGQSSVLRINRDGTQEAIYHDGAGSIPELDQPIDVVLTPDGSLYVVDLRRRVVRFNPAGQVDREWKVPIGTNRGGSKLAVWGDKIAVTNPDNNTVLVIDPGGGATRTLKGTDQFPVNFALPAGVVAAPDGRLYVLNSGDNRLLVLKVEK